MPGGASILGKDKVIAHIPASFSLREKVAVVEVYRESGGVSLLFLAERLWLCWALSQCRMGSQLLLRSKRWLTAHLVLR